MTICIVEDNMTILDNLRLLIDGEPDMDVTGCYTTAEDALREAQWHETDILLVDLKLPGMHGIELIRRVRAHNRDIRIMVHSAQDNRATVMEAIRAGAGGYTVKGCRPYRLVSALRDIYNGGAPACPSVAHIVRAELKSRDDADANPVLRQSILSPREQTILRYLSQGMIYKDIAQGLSITPATVHTHIKNIYRKLNARGKQDAIRKGRYYDLL